MKKTVLLLVRLFACTLLGFTTLRAAESAAPAMEAKMPRTRLLYDVRHSNREPSKALESLTERMNIELVAHRALIDSASLKDISIVQIQGPMTRIESIERDALADFVRQGGALYVITDQESRVPLEPSDINRLLAEFGLEFTADLPYLHNCGALALKGEINRADREIPFSGGRAVKGGTPFSFMLGEDGKPSANVHGAYVKVAKGGRVLALSEAMVAIFLGEPKGERLSGVPNDPGRTTYYGKDSAVFMEETLSWLAQRSPRSNRSDR